MPRSRKSSFGSEYSTKRELTSDKDAFDNACTAAYLSVLPDVEATMTKKKQLAEALRQSGRNPSLAEIDNVWKIHKNEVSFVEFVSIMKKIKPNSKEELLKVFKMIDINNDGFISHSELMRILTSQGEKMTEDDVRKIIRMADVNHDGKLDYTEFCTMMLTTSQQCQQLNFKNLKKSETYENITSKRPISAASNVSAVGGRRISSSSKVVQKFGSIQSVRDDASDSESVITPGRSRVSSPKASSRNVPTIQGNIPNTIVIKQAALVDRKIKVSMPKSRENMKRATSRGCFFIDHDDGSVGTHQYTLEIAQASNIWLKIAPYYLNNADPVANPVDACLIVARKTQARELEFIGITEERDSQLAFCWNGDLRSGSYRLLPFTTGCRFRKRKFEPEDETQLVRKIQNDEIQLSRAFRDALSDIFDICDLDGNGFLNRDEFNWFQIQTSDEEIDDEAWEIVQDNFEMKKGELTREGFMQLHLMQARDKPENAEEELLDTLHCMGYNKALDMDQACPYQIDVYSSEAAPKLTVDSISGNTSLADSLVIKSIVHTNDKQNLKNFPEIDWYVYKSDVRVSSVIHNKSRKTVEIDVDCSEKRNCATSRSRSRFTLQATPSSFFLVDHVMPEDEKKDWSYHCTLLDHSTAASSTRSAKSTSRPTSAKSSSRPPSAKSAGRPTSASKGSILSLF